ncbi:MAG: orotidine-5'-phosphate decarboxylase [Alphaproteobacteria bacterium]|nr:orotidine-5'-phosphate decarboxylase [Alphaproteobacteria bacterium]
MPSHNPIICAIDTTDVAEAKALAASLKPHIGMVKLGLEFFTANGAAGVREVTAGGTPLFLDLKFHDIPNTVAGAVRAAIALKPQLMTIHASGGKAMMQAAADAARGSGAKILGVTVLTSMDDSDLASIGVQATAPDQVRRLADLALRSGLDGIVCSPQEITLLRAHCGKDFTLVTPGIRPAGSDKGDQKRTLTPKEALAHGADHLVIGRPITQAADPVTAAKAIKASL